MSAYVNPKIKKKSAARAKNFARAAPLDICVILYP